MRASASERLTGARERRAALAVAVAGALGAALAAAPHACLAQEIQVEGEYGLYVRIAQDSLRVHWATRDSVPGRLEVFSQREPATVSRTPAAWAHHAAVPLPPGDEAVLRYGAVGGAMYETRVRLRPPRRATLDFRAADSLYVVGDTHGNFEPLVKTLRHAGLIDDALHWKGGRRHLVFAGDLTDRGPYVTRLLWFVYRLEREAERAGGRVHMVLGNHEPMVIMGDLRYVNPTERAVAERHGLRYDELFHTGESVLGRWIASKPAAIRIGRVLITHGGIVPEYARFSLRELDARVARYLHPDTLYREPGPLVTREDTLRFRARDDFLWHPRSIFWFRGYADSDTLGDALADVLRRYRADVMVVGHTASQTIEARYDGRLITAHTPGYGTELLLLVHERNGYRRYRVGAEGRAEGF